MPHRQMEVKFNKTGNYNGLKYAIKLATKISLEIEFFGGNEAEFLQEIMASNKQDKIKINICQKDIFN
jgi:hypothetical protein